jgi:WD40 repeat protein
MGNLSLTTIKDIPTEIVNKELISFLNNDERFNFSLICKQFSKIEDEYYIPFASKLDSVYTLDGHTQWVTQVSFHPNNRYICSGSEDKLIKIWDLETGICIRTSNNFNDNIDDLCFSNDGKFIYSLQGQEIEKFDFELNSVQITNISSFTSFTGIDNQNFFSRKLSLSPSGDTLFLFSHLFLHTYLFDVDLNYITRLPDNGDNLCFPVKDRNFFYISNRLGTKIKYFEDYIQKSSPFDSRCIQHIKSSPNYELICTTSFYNKYSVIIQLFDSKTANLFLEFTVNLTVDDKIFSVFFSPDSKTLWLDYGNGKFSIWDINTKKCFKKIQLPVISLGKTNIIFSFDGKLLCAFPLQENDESSYDERLIGIWKIDYEQARKRTRRPHKRQRRVDGLIKKKSINRNYTRLKKTPRKLMKIYSIKQKKIKKTPRKLMKIYSIKQKKIKKSSKNSKKLY